MENCARLKIEGEIFDDLRKDINMALQKVLKEMTDKDSDEGKILIAIDIKLDKERIPDYSSGQDGKSRDIVKPRFLHKVAHAINIKGERKGGINPEMAMVQDEEDKEAQSQEEANQEEVDDSDSDTDAAIAALPEGSPQLRLSTHQVDLQVGASFQYMDYIESISDDKDETNELYRKIYLTGEVNTSQAGNYEISYYVTDSDKNQSNIEKLTVTVHE